jgi:hypothetical protein
MVVSGGYRAEKAKELCRILFLVVDSAAVAKFR